jgi:hypothetical protein
MRLMRLAVARALWIAWAVLLWNVLLDHAIVVAGREYIAAATRAADSTPRRYENMDAWMRPAVRRGLLTATTGAAIVLASGFLLSRAARAPQR